MRKSDGGRRNQLGESSTEEDESLVAQARIRNSQGKDTSKSTAAFIKIHERYHYPIFNYLYFALRDYQTAEDLAQNTFMKAWRGLPKKKPEAPLKDWLFRIATNEMRAYLRKKVIKILFFLDPSKGESSLPVETQIISGVEATVINQLLLNSLLTKLPLRQKQCLFLYTLQGYSQKEIAVILGISTRSVEALVRRGLKRLKELAANEQEIEKQTDNKS